MRIFWQALLALVSLGFLGAICGVVVVFYVINYYSKDDLPDYRQLKNYEPPIVTRIYAGDGRLMAEYAQERRIFMPIHAIPDRVKHAFISAEDQNFYTHPGVDYTAVVRAIFINLKNQGSGRRLVGASTITQQVAKNFLLSSEVSYERKIKEAILAYRMEEAMSKDQLLELYLNEIFLGQRAYGVAAAALTYFDKSLDELTIAEAAYLAALPKAPNNYHPVKDHDAALARRNWVIGRMVQDGYITQSQADLAIATPLVMTEDNIEEERVSAAYFAEAVRREIEQKYGPESLYQGGLAVRTTIDPRLQNIAEKSLRQGLMDYDHRHGWRGPVQTLANMDDWSQQLAEINPPDEMLDHWRLAVVTDVSAERAKIGFIDKTTGDIPLEKAKWARKSLNDGYALGPEIASVRDVLQAGDVVMVEKDGDSFVLRQIPKVQGALVAIDPHTGRILAMQGGWKSTLSSSFNRVTQAERQPGSAFKPFVYLAALNEGFTPATRVLDAPFVIEQSPGNYWRPTNYSDEFYGPTPIRVGVEKSRNLMTVRLADYIGMEKIVDLSAKLGIEKDMKPFLSAALGAGETTLMRLTSAYGILVNGGKKITPTIIDRVQDRHGVTIYAQDNRECPSCGEMIRWDGQSVPDVPDMREEVVDPRRAYQMVSILEGVVERGTGRKLASLGRPLGGKTGTTNESKDAWFIGFSPDLVVGVFVGFDEPKSLGKRETGSSAAAPIFGYFMEDALKDAPIIPFRIPPGVRMVRVNAATGATAMPGDENVIWEAFVTGTEPNRDDYVLDTGVIDGGGLNPYGEDPYGYESLGYDVNEQQSGVILYDEAGNPYTPESGPAGNNDDPFTSFSQPPLLDENGQILEQPPAPQPQPPPEPTNPAFSGTGGLY